MMLNGDEFSLTQSECGSRRSESPSALMLAQNVSRASSKSAVSVFIFCFFFLSFLFFTLCPRFFSFNAYNCVRQIFFIFFL